VFGSFSATAGQLLFLQHGNDVAEALPNLPKSQIRHMSARD
jgi:hypothetical protein